MRKTEKFLSGFFKQNFLFFIFFFTFNFLIFYLELSPQTRVHISPFPPSHYTQVSWQSANPRSIVKVLQKLTILSSEFIHEKICQSYQSASLNSIVVVLTTLRYFLVRRKNFLLLKPQPNRHIPCRLRQVPAGTRFNRSRAPSHLSVSVCSLFMWL